MAYYEINGKKNHINLKKIKTGDDADHHLTDDFMKMAHLANLSEETFCASTIFLSALFQLMQRQKRNKTYGSSVKHKTLQRLDE